MNMDDVMKVALLNHIREHVDSNVTEVVNYQADAGFGCNSCGNSLSDSGVTVVYFNKSWQPRSWYWPGSIGELIATLDAPELVNPPRSGAV